MAREDARSRLRPMDTGPSTPELLASSSG